MIVIPQNSKIRDSKLKNSLNSLKKRKKKSSSNEANFLSLSRSSYLQNADMDYLYQKLQTNLFWNKQKLLFTNEIKENFLFQYSGANEAFLNENEVVQTWTTTHEGVKSRCCSRNFFLYILLFLMKHFLSEHCSFVCLLFSKFCAMEVITMIQYDVTSWI